jgi:hypothetical protein
MPARLQLPLRKAVHHAVFSVRSFRAPSFKTEQGLPGEYEYSVLQNFELGRRSTAGKGPVEVIQLF